MIRWTKPRFPKEDHLPDWARRDNKVMKGDRVEHLVKTLPPTFRFDPSESMKFIGSVEQ